MNDPLAMAVAVGIARAPGAPVALGADRRARIAAPAGATVLVLDDAGNHLRELAIPDAAPSPPPQPPPPQQPPPIDAPPPAVRTGKISRGWSIATGVSAAVFVGFGIAALGVDRAVSQDLAQSETHHLDDVESLHALERVFVGVAIVGGAAMIVSAIPLTASILKSKDTWITPSPVGVGVSIGRRW